MVSSYFKLDVITFRREITVLGVGLFIVIFISTLPLTKYSKTWWTDTTEICIISLFNTREVYLKFENDSYKVLWTDTDEKTRKIRKSEVKESLG